MRLLIAWFTRAFLLMAELADCPLSPRQHDRPKLAIEAKRNAMLI